MIITNKQKIKEEKIILNNKIIGHSKTIKVLGTVFNEHLNWKDHLESGQNNLITQLKQRKSAIMKLAKNVSNKFLLQYANSIFISKLNYHIELWGACLKTIKNKIDDIQMSIAIIIVDKPYG